MPLGRWLVLAVIAGCGGQTSSTPGSATNNAPLQKRACIPVVPVRLLVLEHGSEWEPMADLLADGTIVYAGKSAVARIANDQVADLRGQPVFACVNGELRAPGHTRAAHFEPNGDLVDSMMRIHVEPTGQVFMATGGRPPQSMGCVEGPQQSPRTAAILSMVTLAYGNWSFR